MCYFHVKFVFLSQRHVTRKFAGVHNFALLIQEFNTNVPSSVLGDFIRTFSKGESKTKACYKTVMS